jgi:hypothetical protein
MGANGGLGPRQEGENVRPSDGSQGAVGAVRTGARGDTGGDETVRIGVPPGAKTSVVAPSGALEVLSHRLGRPAREREPGATGGRLALDEPVRAGARMLV